MSTAERYVTVQVAYASAEVQVVREVRLAQGGTVGQAIDASGMSAILPDGLPEPLCVGIHSHKVAKDHVLEDGDRVEIYRPLVCDPMEARRRRAQAD